MTENYKKRIKTIEKIEQNDIIKIIVRTIGGKAIMFLKGREKAYGEVFKENFQNRKDQKENYDIVYCCHRIDVNRNNIGGNYVVLYDKAV